MTVQKKAQREVDTLWGEGKKGDGYGYKRVTRGILVLLAPFCLLTVVVDTQICTCDKIAWNLHTHTYTLVH